MALGRWAPYRFPWSNVSNVFFWELLELFHANTQRFHPGIPQQGRPLTGPRGFRLSQKKGVGKGELKWINQQTPHRIHGNGIFANIYLTKSAKCRNILHTLILWASKRQVSWLRVFLFLCFFFVCWSFVALKHVERLKQLPIVSDISGEGQGVGNTNPWKPGQFDSSLQQTTRLGMI